MIETQNPAPHYQRSFSEVNLVSEHAERIAQRCEPTDTATDQLWARVFAAGMPIVACFDSAKDLSIACVDISMITLKSAGKWVGLNTFTQHDSLQLQAWRIAKALAKLALAVVATITIPFALVYPLLVVKECEMLGLWNKPTNRPLPTPPTPPPQPATPSNWSRLFKPINNAITSVIASSSQPRLVQAMKDHPTIVTYVASIIALAFVVMIDKMRRPPIKNDNPSDINNKDNSSHINIETIPHVGTLNFVDGGLLYEGDILNGAMHGKGKKYFLGGPVMYEGDFVNNTMHGNGTLYRRDGTTAYVGEFFNNTKHGRGTEYYPSGWRQFIGNFENDGWKNGTMYRRDSDQVWYEGSFGGFLSRRWHGNGTLYDPHGNVKHRDCFNNGNLC